jgi:hypothetical protein
MLHVTQKMFVELRVLLCNRRFRWEQHFNQRDAAVAGIDYSSMPNEGKLDYAFDCFRRFCRRRKIELLSLIFVDLPLFPLMLSFFVFVCVRFVIYICFLFLFSKGVPSRSFREVASCTGH